MIKRFGVILAFLIFVAADGGRAWADCNIAPSGSRPEGAIVYNSDYNVLQYCAGTQWKAIVWNASGSSCPQGYTVHGQSCYRTYYGTNYDASRATCQADGGDLVVINSADENDIVEFFTYGWYAYIGYDDQATEGTFEWVSGSSSYTKWSGGQPDDAGGLEDCAIINSGGGGWDDTDCSSNQPYSICEVAVAAGGGSCPVGYFLLDGSCYRISDALETWDDARTACQSESADLVTFVDAAEFDAINTLRGSSDHLWIGYRETAQDVWEWVSPSSYTNWGGGAPNGGAPNDCGGMHAGAGGLIDDDWCGEARRYVCEADPL